MIVAVVIPLMKPIGLPFAITEQTQKTYNVIESLKPGAMVVVGFDYSPGSASELDPQAIAMVDHLFQKGAKVVAISLTDSGPLIAEKVFATYSGTKKAGVDYVNLGFFAGDASTVLTSFAKDAHKIAKVDFRGVTVDQLEIMKKLTKAEDVDLYVNFSSSSILPFIENFVGPYKKPLVGGAIGSQISRYQSYANSGQIKGFLGSLRGAAEYEMLLKKPAKATAAMDAQSAAHLLIAILMIIGNVMTYITRRQAARRGGAA